MSQARMAQVMRRNQARTELTAASEACNQLLHKVSQQQDELLTVPVAAVQSLLDNLLHGQINYADLAEAAVLASTVAMRLKMDTSNRDMVAHANAINDIAAKLRKTKIFNLKSLVAANLALYKEAKVQEMEALIQTAEASALASEALQASNADVALQARVHGLPLNVLALVMRQQDVSCEEIEEATKGRCDH